MAGGRPRADSSDSSASTIFLGKVVHRKTRQRRGAHSYGTPYVTPLSPVVPPWHPPLEIPPCLFPRAHGIPWHPLASLGDPPPSLPALYLPRFSPSACATTQPSDISLHVLRFAPPDPTASRGGGGGPEEGDGRIGGRFSRDERDTKASSAPFAGLGSSGSSLPSHQADRPSTRPSVSGSTAAQVGTNEESP